MNPNFQTNDTDGGRLITPQIHGNQGARPAGINPFNSHRQVRPFRMESPRPNGRNEYNYQSNFLQQNQPLPQSNMEYQQQHQQNVMQQSHQRQFNIQQQQNQRFPLNEPKRPPINPASNPQPNSPQNNQIRPRPPFEGQRIQMEPQIQFPSSQYPLRVPLNPNPTEVSNRNNLQNYQRMEAPKPPIDQIQANFQNFNQAENYKIQTSSSANLDKPLPGHEKSNEPEMKLQATFQKDNFSNPAVKEQTPVSSSAESKSEISEMPSDSNENAKSHSENTNKIKKAGSKTQDKIRKERKDARVKEETIKSGMVQKNIKFFEENDTAKLPLTPETPTAKKKEKTPDAPNEVVMKGAGKDEHESGVDETPVIHPNLGSIFQVPRKVARIPNFKRNKQSKKLKSNQPSKYPLNLNKNQMYRAPMLSEFSVNLALNPGDRKRQKQKTYESKEELLAFFENTKSWRKQHGYGSNLDRNAAKDTPVNKPTTNGDILTLKKPSSKPQTPSKKNLPASPLKTPLKSPGTPGTPGTKSLPKTPESPAPPQPLIKKVPMNKIQVGAAPSPNLKTVRSKIGSLANTTHKPGGGNVKIESHKIDLSKVQPRTEAKNDMYKPSGGEKKIQQVKLQWNAQSKVGSLENATYKPRGGDKKIESVKLDFREKAKPKVGSKDNVKHVPGGGNVKIDNQKLDFKAQSKVGSLDNVKHKPGGGDIKIFDDKTYLRQVSGNSSEGRVSEAQALSDLSVGRSAPGTPGRSTSVKIRKITTMENSGESPKVKNITRVAVVSQTPKSPEKHQVKVTYTKMSSKSEDTEIPLGIIKLPANNDAPFLKASLGKKDLHDDKALRKHSSETDNTHKTMSHGNIQSTGQLHQNFMSSNLGKPNRDEIGMFKFSQDKTITQEKIEDIRRERNDASIKSNPSNIGSHEEQQNELPPSSSVGKYEFRGTHSQFRPQNPTIRTDAESISTESNLLTSHSNQSLGSDQIFQNPVQSQHQEQIHQ